MAIPYRPLDRNRQEVRFLSQSCANVRSGRLEYELAHWSFDEATPSTKLPFLALSYVWGPKEAQDGSPTISVDGTSVAVSRNLRAALSSLCNPDPRSVGAGENLSAEDGWERTRYFDSIEQVSRVSLLEGQTLLIGWMRCVSISLTLRRNRTRSDLCRKYTRMHFVSLCGWAKRKRAMNWLSI